MCRHISSYVQDNKRFKLNINLLVVYLLHDHLILRTITSVIFSHMKTW